MRGSRSNLGASGTKGIVGIRGLLYNISQTTYILVLLVNCQNILHCRVFIPLENHGSKMHVYYLQQTIANLTLLVTSSAVTALKATQGCLICQSQVKSHEIFILQRGHGMELERLFSGVVA